MVLLDQKFPKIDGLGVLRHIWEDEFTRQLPVVILAYSDEDKVRLAGDELGTDSFDRNPVFFAEFSRAVAGLAH